MARLVSGDGNPNSWAVEADGRLIGTARLHALSEEDRHATYAIGILDPLMLNVGWHRSNAASPRTFVQGLRLHPVGLTSAGIQRQSDCLLPQVRAPGGGPGTGVVALSTATGTTTSSWASSRASTRQPDRSSRHDHAAPGLRQTMPLWARPSDHAPGRPPLSAHRQRS